MIRPTAGELLDRGVAAVLVTSSSSVTTITAEGSATVAVDPVPVADTVGAGDSFCGGVLAQLWERGIHTPGALATVALAEWREIVAFAIRVAGITVQRVGADPPRRDEALTIPGGAKPRLPVGVSGVFELRAPTR